MTDHEIILQILQGDRNLYRKLVERYQPMVFRTAMGFLHNKEDADDLTQDVFLQTYQTLSVFKGEATFSTWIYRITVNAALNRVRKSSKNQFLQRLENVFGFDKGKANSIATGESESPEILLIQAERNNWVEKALNSLPEKQRTAIVLSKYDDLSQKEIAEIMETTEGAVEALIQRAKVNLRQKLSSFDKKISI